MAKAKTTKKDIEEAEIKAKIEKAAQVTSKTTKSKVTKKSVTTETEKQKKPSTAKATDKQAKKVKADINKDLSNISKKDIIGRFATKDGDTGSPEVQIALSTQKILNLSSHLGDNPKDNHSRRGLLKIIAKRRRILHYLSDKDERRYKELIKNLGLKK